LTSAYRHEIILLAAVLAIAAAVRLPGLLSRSIWFDEAITLLETAGHASPTWPREPTPASVAKRQLEGAASFGQILKGLRRTDIHPPVYYWLLSIWRGWFGSSLETARLFSLLCSLATLLVFYLLLRVGDFPYPLVPTAIYALSASAVHFSQDARAYALAVFFLMTAALLAYVTVQASPHKQRIATPSAIVLALCCGAAFQTHYLSLFPVAVILLWFVGNLWPRSRLVALGVPLLAAAVSLADFATFLGQLGMRRQFLAGVVGPVEELRGLLRLTAVVFWAPTSAVGSFAPVIYGGFAALVGLSCLSLFRHWREVNQGWWLLVVGLAAAPSLGIGFLDVFFAKHLHLPRYVMFAGPALAIFVSYGLIGILAARRRLGGILLTVVVGVQLLTVNWGSSADPTGTAFTTARWRDARRLARTIQRTSASSHVVLIGAGSGRGRGTPGALVYELAPQTMVSIVDNSSDLDALEVDMRAYQDVWIILDSEGGVEAQVRKRLEESGLYREISGEHLAVQLRRGAESHRD
jgi:hypothetical protein